MFAITALYRISQSRTRSLSMFAELGSSLSTTIAMAKVRASDDEVLVSIVVLPEVLESA